mgnify:CR=1 FL=1
MYPTEGDTHIKAYCEAMVNFSLCKIASVVLSSYVMDTFVKTRLKEVKKITSAKIISNGSAEISLYSDADRRPRGAIA